MSNRSGTVTLPNLGLQIPTSEGLLESKIAKDNFKILDSVAGPMQVQKYLFAFNPLVPLLLPDVWYPIAVPNADLAALGVLPQAKFDDVIRLPGVSKILGLRARAVNLAGVGLGWLNIQLRRAEIGAAPVPGAALPDALLMNPVKILGTVAADQNVSRLGTEAKVSVGSDKTPITVWMSMDPTFNVAGWDIELLVLAQLLPDVAPDFTE